MPKMAFSRIFVYLRILNVYAWFRCVWQMHTERVHKRENWAKWMHHIIVEASKLCRYAFWGHMPTHSYSTAARFTGICWSRRSDLRILFRLDFHEQTRISCIIGSTWDSYTYCRSIIRIQKYNVAICFCIFLFHKVSWIAMKVIKFRIDYIFTYFWSNTHPPMC